MPVGWPPSAGLTIIFMDADLWSVGGQKSPPYHFSPRPLPVNPVSLLFSPWRRDCNIRSSLLSICPSTSLLACTLSVLSNVGQTRPLKKKKKKIEKIQNGTNNISIFLAAGIFSCCWKSSVRGGLTTAVRSWWGGLGVAVVGALCLTQS